MTTAKDTIEDLAYRIWEEEGRPEGRDLDHWLKAEAAMQTAKKPKAAPKPKADKAKADKPKAKDAAKPKAKAKTPALVKA